MHFSAPLIQTHMIHFARKVVGPEEGDVSDTLVIHRSQLILPDNHLARNIQPFYTAEKRRRHRLGQGGGDTQFTIRYVYRTSMQARMAAIASCAL